MSITRSSSSLFTAKKRDQVGTPKLIVDVATGKVVRQYSFDEFGIELDHPGSRKSDEAVSIPFGFAGGLYDKDTGLVRFGARDYDPETGRWTSKDPILFNGGDTNLYGYTFNDPVNFIDSDGKNAALVLVAPYLAFETGFFIGATINRFAFGIPYSQTYQGANPLLNLTDSLVPTSGFFLDPTLGQSLTDIFKRKEKLTCE